MVMMEATRVDDGFHAIFSSCMQITSAFTDVRKLARAPDE
jgi:hypothetical protein